MSIKNLSFTNLRNLENGSFTLDENINILYGDNAQGKTNILEAIYFASVGRSHRTSNYKELIKLGEKSCVFTLDNVKINLTKNSKEIYVDGFKIKKLDELLGNILVVIFAPEDLYLIKEGPNLRRKFIDITLCQLNRLYYYELGLYYKALNQRNALLKKNEVDTIFIWDEQLINHGEKIMNIRRNYVKELDAFAKEIHKEISGGKEEISITYKPNAYNFRDKLQKNLERDLILKSTSSGIHRDDILVEINSLETKVYGSQGQIRTASLALKLSSVLYINKEKGEFPIILLDDVFSELDKGRINFLLKFLEDKQSVITCTGNVDFLENLKINKKIIKEGKINE